MKSILIGSAFVLVLLAGGLNSANAKDKKPEMKRADVTVIGSTLGSAQQVEAELLTQGIKAECQMMSNGDINCTTEQAHSRAAAARVSPTARR